ncbi:MAG: energy transducer TonB [Bacteroidia bacterium]
MVRIGGLLLFFFQACNSPSPLTVPANSSSRSKDSLFEITPSPDSSSVAPQVPMKTYKRPVPSPEPPKKSECASYLPPQDLSAFPAPNEAVLVDKEAVPLNLSEVKARIPKPKQKGKVVLRVLVGDDGRYITHQVLKSTDPKLTQAVEGVACKLEFLAASRAGKPIPLWTTVSFEF